jgi:hypothetical protein
MNQKCFSRLMGLMAALCSYFTLAHTVLAQGSLTPPTAPGPTMVSLSQIYAKLDARIAITNSATPVILNQPGSYYLTTNLTTPPGVAITIATNDVTLDLNGYTVSSSSLGASATAILLNNNLRNITIRNGIIQSGVTNKAGTYSGPGFYYGIYGTSLTNITVSGISVSGVQYDGIFLGTANSTLVENSVVMTAGSYGIEASTVKTSIASDCGNTAIYADLVSDSRGISSGSGYGIIGNTVLNCYGQAIGAIGLSATTAQNCYGYCTGASAGINATTAQNCYGFSINGAGLGADEAQNCYGYCSSGSGAGVSVTHAAQNCYGYSYNSYGLYAYIAMACVGTSTGYYGLVATIGNSSIGTTVSGTPESVTYKYNMP